MLQDLRFAVRLFARQRGFFVTAVLTIALGVGLSATVFAVVDGVLFRPLPYRDPSRLVTLFGAVRAEGNTAMPVSLPDLLDWRAAARSIQQIEGYELGAASARVRGADGSTQVVSSGPVTAGFLDMLGVNVTRGRTFAAGDFDAASPPVALISHNVWRRVFGSGDDVLG